MATMNSMENMAQVIHWIETDTPFTPAFQKKVLGSVRKMVRLPHYGVPLDQIPADLQAFDKVWGRGPVRGLPGGFKSKGSFTDWRSQVRSALTKALEVVPAVRDVQIEDDWALLTDDLLKANVPPKKLIPVSVLANAARDVTITPVMVSREWLQKLVDESDTAGRYRAIQAAVKLIGKHRDTTSVAVSPVFDMDIHKSRAHCVRAELPPALTAEIKKWRAQRVAGEPRGHRDKPKGACSAERSDQVLQGVTYVYTAMLEAGLVQKDDACKSDDLKRPELLEEVIERELEGENPWKKLQPTTLFEYLNNWKLFIKGCGHDTTLLTELMREYSAFENVKSMASGRRSWCEKFLHDYHKKSAFLSLPGRLFEEAQQAMKGYETASHHKQQSAIALSLAACAAAIWTSLPLRISTLLNLTYGGPDADVQIHGARRGIVVTTRPKNVKNDYSHRYINLTPKQGGDPRKIVEWFVQDVRPLLLEEHVASHKRRDNLLFGGVSYARLSGIWRQVTLEAGVPMTPHQVRHALATLMANQKNADYSVIAALLGDTEATVRKNYVFVDQARLHAEGQELLAQIQGHLLMKGAV